VGFLKRMLGGGDPAPEWASFFSGAEYRAFLAAVDADLRRRGRTFRIDDGVVLLDEPGADEPSQLGLSNLAQHCRGTHQDDWPRVIADHFTNVFQTVGRDLDALAADYDQVAPILRVRLMPDESMGGVELPESVLRAGEPGYVEVLVYDFPDSTASVHRDHLAAWPVDRDGAWAQALDNLTSEPDPIRDEVASPDARFTMWYGDSFYVATRLLRLASMLPPGTVDAIAAVPNRHTLLVHVIEDATVVESIKAMQRATVDLFRDGPGSISDRLYWWHAGTLAGWRQVGEGRRAEIQPPDGLVEVLMAASERPPRAS
jgi:hypothetical protein